jgi:hypothetical protein
MPTGYSTAENLKLLGAAIITGSTAHALLCLATLPGLVGAPYTGFIGGGAKVAGIVWTVAGVLAGIFVALQALAIFRRRDLDQARMAAVGVLVLPSLGLVGGISAFALVPLGVGAYWLLRQPAWYGQFLDFAPEPWVDPAGGYFEQPEEHEEQLASDGERAHGRRPQLAGTH